jgi:peptidoglycan/LPS O-acetylase OafA/YrhL
LTLLAKDSTPRKDTEVAQVQRPIYIPALDGLRAVAFFIVFVAHSMPSRQLPGGFGVTVFFLLSGYLITTLLRSEAEHRQSVNLKNFYLRRLLRIFPPCDVTLVIVTSLACVGLLYNTECYRSLPAAFLYFSNCWNILGLGNLPAGMGVLWSLAVEEHYYLLFPVLYAWFVYAGVS